MLGLGSNTSPTKDAFQALSMPSEAKRAVNTYQISADGVNLKLEELKDENHNEL